MNVKDKIYYGTIDDIIKALRRVPNRDNDEIIYGQWKFEKTPIFENDHPNSIESIDFTDIDNLTFV